MSILGIIGDAVSAATHFVSDLEHGNVLGALGDLGGEVGKLMSAADPLSKLVDIASKELGLPDALTDVIKVGAGLVTGDYTCVADGALEGFDALSHAPQAHTDYCRSPARGIMDYPGYARPPQSYHPPANSNPGPVPPNYGPMPTRQPPSATMSYLNEKAQAYQTLEKSLPKTFGMFSFKLDRDQLEEWANSGSAPADLKRAAQFLLQHEDAFDQVAQSDGKISLTDLQNGLKDTNTEIRNGGVGAAEAEGNTPAQLQEKLKAFQTLHDEFGNALGEDGFFGSMDHKIDLDTLKDIANDSDASPELKRAARYVVDHPEAYAEIARTGNEISQGDLQIAIEDTQKKLGRVSNTGVVPPSYGGEYGSSTSPVGSASSGSSTSSSGMSADMQSEMQGLSNQITDILNNPNMSIEEKIMEILMLLQQKNDLDLNQAMGDLNQVQGERNSIDRKGDDAQSQLDKNSQDSSRVQFQIQQLMDKRKQLSELMSNIEASFNEMAKTAIQNVAR